MKMSLHPVITGAEGDRWQKNQQLTWRQTETRSPWQHNNVQNPMFKRMKKTPALNLIFIFKCSAAAEMMRTEINPGTYKAACCYICSFFLVIYSGFTFPSNVQNGKTNDQQKLNRRPLCFLLVPSGWNSNVPQSPKSAQHKVEIKKIQKYKDLDVPEF